MVFYIVGSVLALFSEWYSTGLFIKFVQEAGQCCKKTNIKEENNIEQRRSAAVRLKVGKRSETGECGLVSVD